MGNSLMKRLRQWRYEQKTKNVLKDCFSCNWFQFPKTGLRNRQCQCPYETGPDSSGKCRRWILDPNWRHRTRGAWGVVT